MATWTVNRTHVSASELGTNAPWIPGALQINADYFALNGPFVEFKDTFGKVVYCIRQKFIREIVRSDAIESGKVHQCSTSRTVEEATSHETVGAPTSTEV